MATAASIAVDSAPPLPPRRLIAFLAMCFGMFMAFLDIQIVSSSLAEIQAGLSASADEIPWVQTSYLIAEIIVIPLSGWLSRVQPRSRFTVRALSSSKPAALRVPRARTLACRTLASNWSN